MAEASKPKSLDEVLKNAAKKYDLRVGSLADVVEPAVFLTTGNLAIDTATGGGIPLRRSVELYGPPSCGKTTTALQTAAELQRVIRSGGDSSRGIAADDVMVYFDFEHALDKDYATALGLDLTHPSFKIAQPDNLEQGANVARDLISTGRVRMTIWDSVAAMTPSAFLDAETGKASVALQARLMSDFLKVMNPLLNEHNSAAVFLNHIAEAIDMGGRPGVKRYTTPGGRALKFYASVRVEYQQVKNHKGSVADPLTGEPLERVVSSDVRVRVVKNKLAPPFRETLVRVRFGAGFDNFWTAMQVLLAQKKVVYSTGYFYFEKSPELVWDDMPRQAAGSKRPYIRGEESLFEFADEHPSWRSSVIEAAASIVASNTSVGEQLVRSGEVVEDPEEGLEPVVASVPAQLVPEGASVTASLLGTP